MTEKKKVASLIVVVIRDIGQAKEYKLNINDMLLYTYQTGKNN